MSAQKSTVEELQKRIAALPPEKRAIFEQQLKKKNLQLSQPTITKRKNNNFFPLSFAQERLWFIHQLDPNNSAYHIPIAWRFTGKLNITTLKSSINEIIRRHEALRTRFPSIEGKPCQEILPSLTLAVPIIDLQELPQNQQEITVQYLSTETAKRPFNLETGPLLRVILVQLSPEENILLVIFHHIIADGWSRGIFLKELATLYKSDQKLSELPIQYVDFADWQQQWLLGQELNLQLDYWKQQLADLPVLNLPTDFPRPASQTFRGATQSFNLPKSLTEILKQISRREGTTLFMTLLTAFKILLHRYTHQEDIVIGSPIAGRNWAETEGLIGFFVNSLVLRTYLSGNPTFLELLKRVQKVTAGAYKHQDLPFAKLVEELQPERNLSHNPVFQVMFQLQNEAYQFQNALSPELAIPGLTLNQFWIEPHSTKFDLTWHLIERKTGILGVIEYSTDLFKPETIARMVNHFRQLLENIVANPQARISQLPILTKTEQSQLLIEWNNTLTDYPSKYIHQLFEEQVERTPDHIAVVCGHLSLTYQELNQKANQLAHYLQRLGTTKETLVGIYLKRSLEMVVGLLGILKAGGAYVPLDPAYPKARIAYMLEDAKVSILLTQGSLKADLPLIDADIVCLDSEWNTIAQNLSDNLACSVEGDNLAYIIYTSGSTGQPKGTLLTHQGLANYLNWAIQAYRVAEGKGSPVQSSIGFDATITSLYTPLLVGQTVTLLPEEQEIEALSAVLSHKNHYSLVKLTPAHLTILSQLLPANQEGHPNALIIGGEALSKNSLSFWQTHAPNTRLINEYGPTETVVGCCVYEIFNQTFLSNTVPIGRPIANTQLYILDRYLQPVSIGVPGELYIGGAGVARGYLNQPDLTAEKFIPNPFSQGGRLYKTGDLARYFADGTIEYLGRLDNQVKVRGFRIELGEIETRLIEHPDIKEALVTVQNDSQGNKKLIAYVVPSSVETLHATSLQRQPETSVIRQFLKTKLPDYMIPSVFVTLSAFPLTANGKIDRQALPSPDLSSKDIAPSVEPRTNNEKILAAIWAEVLGQKSVSIYDNFFELGGDSILSIQIIAKATQAGLKITPKQVFQHQTIAELAMVAETVYSSSVEQGIVTGAIPLTPIQHWFFEQNLLEPHHYNQSVLLEMMPDLKPNILKQSLQQLLIHHDALRLRFISSNFNEIQTSPPTPLLQGEGRKAYSGWQQINTAPTDDVPFTIIDLSQFKPSEQKVILEKCCTEVQKNINLSDGSILKYVLFHLGEGQSNRLLIVIHHLAVDGVSWRILLEDLSLIYQQLAKGEKIKLPPKTTSYKDWANNLIAYSQSEALTAEQDYWLEIDRLKVVSLPVDSSFNINNVASTAQVSVFLEAEQTEALLTQITQFYNTQINDVLLTALGQAFARWTGQSNLLVDLESHGREMIFNNLDLSRTVGWFTSIFPVCLNLTDINKLGESLKKIKEQLRRIPQGGIGYGILRYLKQSVFSSKADIIFNYFGQLDKIKTDYPMLCLAKESSGYRRSPQQIRRYLLEINSYIKEGKLFIDWIYSQNIHQKATIEGLAQDYLAALRSLIAHCLSSDAGGFTPSDFSAARLNQKQLDQFLTKIQKSGRK